MTIPDTLKSIANNSQEVKELTQAQKNKFIVCLDSTQINRFKTCEEKWNLSDNLGLELISPWIEQNKRAMKLGILGHKFLDRFYKSRAERIAPNVAMRDALTYDHKTNPDCESLVIEDATKVRDRTRQYYHFYNTLGGGVDFHVSNPNHVEVGFSELLYEDSERLYILEGRIDLITKVMEMDCIVDHKYQLNAHDIYQKIIQFRNYAMVSRMKILIINYIRLANATNPDTFKREFISFTDQEHFLWRRRLTNIYHRVYNRMVNDNGLFDKNEAACPGEFGKQCEFTQLCEELNAIMHEQKKHSLYQIKKEWRPW